MFKDGARTYRKVCNSLPPAPCDSRLNTLVARLKTCVSDSGEHYSAPLWRFSNTDMPSERRNNAQHHSIARTDLVKTRTSRDMLILPTCNGEARSIIKICDGGVDRICSGIVLPTGHSITGRVTPASECGSCVVRSTLFHQSDHLRRARRPFYGRLKLPSSRRRPSRPKPCETAGPSIDSGGQYEYCRRLSVSRHITRSSRLRPRYVLHFVLPFVCRHDRQNRNSHRVNSAVLYNTGLDVAAALTTQNHRPTVGVRIMVSI